MKRLIMIVLVLVFTSGMALAGGDQNQGTTGTGTTSTGTTSQGSGSQDRTGR